MAPPDSYSYSDPLSVLCVDLHASSSSVPVVLYSTFFLVHHMICHVTWSTMADLWKVDSEVFRWVVCSVMSPSPHLDVLFLVLKSRNRFFLITVQNIINYSRHVIYGSRLYGRLKSHMTGEIPNEQVFCKKLWVVSKEHYIHLTIPNRWTLSVSKVKVTASR